MNFIKLRISGENLDIDLINNLLKISPTISYKKDETKIYKGEKIVYQEDCWMAQIEIANDKDFEFSIKNFLGSFYESKEFIFELSKKHSVTLWISLYPEDTQMNIHLSDEIMSFISELGISVDISIMCLQEFYNN